MTQSSSTNPEETIKFFIYSVILIATPIGKPSAFYLEVDHKKNLELKNKQEIKGDGDPALLDRPCLCLLPHHKTGQFFNSSIKAFY